MPDFGVALSGTGDGLAIPVADFEPTPAPPPQVKTLVAPPRVAKANKECTATLVKPVPVSVPRPEFPASVRDFAGDGKVRGEHYVRVALAEKNADLRIVGVRLARQLKMDPAAIALALASDASPQVLRECAVALHQSDSPQVAKAWAALADRHDGKDR